MPTRGSRRLVRALPLGYQKAAGRGSRVLAKVLRLGTALRAGHSLGEISHALDPIHLMEGRATRAAFSLQNTSTRSRGVGLAGI